MPKKSFSADKEELYYRNNNVSDDKKTTDKEKDDKEKDKDKNKSIFEILHLNLERVFTIFTIGAFLMGTPMMVGLFSAAIAAILIKKGYDYFSNKSDNALKSTRDAFNAVKKASDGPLPNKYNDYIDVARTKEGTPANKEEFINNIQKSTQEFLDTEIGKKALENKEFNNMFKKCTGMELTEVMEKNKDLAKNVELADKEAEKEIVNDADELKSDIDEKEVNRESIYDLPRESEINDREDSIKTREDTIVSNAVEDQVIENENVTLMDIPDNEFDREIATKEDIINESKQVELEKDSVNKDVIDINSIENK